MQGTPKNIPSSVPAPHALVLNHELRGQVVMVAQLEMREPQQVLDMLLGWALRQHRLLDFDVGTLDRVDLSVSDYPFDWDDQTECVVSGEWQAADGTLSRLLVR